MSPGQICPACGEVGRWSFHAHYQKYHFSDRIDIRRVRCRPCRTTHALIPIFSVPQSSLGMQELEQFYLGRNLGQSRRTACQPILDAGWEARVAKRLEGRLRLAVDRAKAIWPQAADLVLSPLLWLIAATGIGDRPLVAMNRFALSDGVNAILFCRSSILFFRPGCSARGASHRRESAARQGPGGRMGSSNQPGGP